MCTLGMWVLYAPLAVALSLAAPTDTGIKDAILAPKATDALDTSLQTVDELHAKGETKQELDLVSQLAKDQPSADVLWRQARATYDWAGVQGSEGSDIKKALILDAAALAQNALALGSTADTEKWAAITMSRRDDYVGTNEKIQDSFAIRDHMDAALRLNPDDAGANHIRGMWNFRVADIGFLERQIAKAFFDTLPEATYAEALPYLERSEQLSPTIRNRVALGDCHDRLGHSGEAGQWYAKALELVPRVAEEREVQEQTRKAHPQ